MPSPWDSIIRANFTKGSSRCHRSASRLPHVQELQTNRAAFFRAEPSEELVQAGLGTFLAAKPERAAPLHVADDDAILVALGKGDRVDADHPGGRAARPAELLPHVV